MSNAITSLAGADALRFYAHANGLQKGEMIDILLLRLKRAKA